MSENKNRPTSIRPSPVLLAYIEGISKGKGATAAINDLFERYQVLRNELALKLTDGEKAVIHAMLHGVALNDAQFIIACLALPQDIGDEEFRGLPSSDTLAEKLKSVTPAQLVATVDSLGY